MNEYHKEAAARVYPFLEREWDAEGSALSEYLEYDEIMAGFVEEVRKRTSPGTNRLVQMACLYRYDRTGTAWAIAHFHATPDWPVEYQLEKVNEAFVYENGTGKEVRA